MRNLENITKLYPVLADHVAESVNKFLKRDLFWLDQALGIAWNVTKLINGKQYTDPCLYVKDNEYESLVPSDDLGNYSFWVRNGATNVDGKFGIVRQRLSLIVWFNLDTTFSTKSRRDTENLKNDIVNSIRGAFIKDGSIEVVRVYEEMRDVWNGYTITEDTNQFMMHPYAAFRIECDVTSKLSCV